MSPQKGIVHGVTRIQNMGEKILIRQAPSYDEVHIIPRNQEGNHLAQSRHQSAVDPLIARARCLRVWIAAARWCVWGTRGRVRAQGGGVGWRIRQGPALDIGGDVAHLSREWCHRDGGQEEQYKEHGACHRWPDLCQRCCCVCGVWEWVWCGVLFIGDREDGDGHSICA